MKFEDLTDDVRASMLAEIDGDEAAGVLITSKRLSPKGIDDYPQLLREAIRFHNPAWLAMMLNIEGRLNKTEQRRSRGSIQIVKVAHTAAATLAEGEMNRFYIRGLCALVIAQDVNSELEVYRAKEVSEPRPASQWLIGTRVKATKLLDDLRQNIGIDTSLGVPAGPNSGLSVRIPAAA